jgi:hypothetical protein
MPENTTPAVTPSSPALLHPRNRHQGRYDFPRLIEASPELAEFVILNPYGKQSIDFANPEAVRVFNRALLRQLYGLQHWDIPPGYLCPPIPGRADYVHGLADLLASDNSGEIPRGAAIRALDICSAIATTAGTSSARTSTTPPWPQPAPSSRPMAWARPSPCASNCSAGRYSRACCRTASASH